MQNPSPGSVIMFTTVWCGYCRQLKAAMDRVGISYSEVDIEHDDTAAAFVTQANGGNQTVPTLLFPDGSTATNPPLAQVQAKLAG